jgi:predicted RND superfamily exporter protein
MGQKLAHFVLQYRVYILIIIALITGFFAYKATTVEFQYEMPKLLPHNHVDNVTYREFKEQFGKDGFKILIGVQDKDFYTVEKYNKWQELGEELNKMKGIDSVFSEASFYSLVKDDSLKRFRLKALSPSKVNSQERLDSIKEEIRSLPFYRETIYNDDSDFHCMVATVNPEFFNSKKRGEFVSDIEQKARTYEQFYNSDLYFTGLPFIRATNMTKIKEELSIFMMLSLLVTVITLFFFFRSFRVIAISGLIVVVGVIWTMGIIGVFNYELSAIMGLLPPLVIVIGIPNCVYLINKYQQLYIDTKDKDYALKNVIVKIGAITLVTNITTAFGLSTFVFTDSVMLYEFGVVAFFSILLLFLITVLLVPILFSYLPAPKAKHTKHLEKKWVAGFIKLLENLVNHKRKAVYLLSFAVAALSIVGFLKLKASGKMLDDLPQGDKVQTDLAFFQDNLTGVMPLEIVLDVKKKGRLQQTKTLERMDSVQRYLESYDKVGRTVSIVDALKFINQAFYSGNPEKYNLPSGRDKAFIKKYISNNAEGNTMSMKMFIDSTGTKTRISSQVHDIGVDKLDSLLIKITPKVDEILNPDKVSLIGIIEQVNFDKTAEDNILILDSLFDEYRYMESSYLSVLKEEDSALAEKWYDEGLDYAGIISRGKEKLIDAANQTFIDNKVTGQMVPFTRGTQYLIFNLFISLLIAIVGISILMSFLFRSFWMVLITLITNMLPLIFTAGLMGYFGVALKPSTILVFSISLGIAVDDAIHYLAKFKQELKATGGNLELSVHNALKETGVSMFYTSIILFFGFSIFIASSYGGTQALGFLISVTLLVAMLSNLVLLPSLLLSFKSRIEKE